jgi:hypothetical protein
MPKVNLNFIALMISKITIPTILPIIALINPRIIPSDKKRARIFEGKVPIEAMVPISPMRS